MLTFSITYILISYILIFTKYGSITSNLATSLFVSTLISTVLTLLGTIYHINLLYKLSIIIISCTYLYVKPFANKSFNNRLLLNIGGIVSIILIAIQ